VGFVVVKRVLGQVLLQIFLVFSANYGSINVPFSRISHDTGSVGPFRAVAPRYPASHEE
jgi:hypothetical protein